MKSSEICLWPGTCRGTRVGPASLAEVTLGPGGRPAVLVGRSLEKTRGPESEPVNRGATTRPGKKDAMRTNARKTVLLGDLVVAAFDIAARYSSDPRVVSALATRAVMRPKVQRMRAPIA